MLAFCDESTWLFFSLVTPWGRDLFSCVCGDFLQLVSGGVGTSFSITRDEGFLANFRLH